MAKDKKESKYAQVAKISDAAVVPILRKVSGTRSARAFFMRKSTANLMERLSDAEQDAMIQIAVYRQIVLGGVLNFRQFGYMEVCRASGVANDPQTRANFIIDAVARYSDWIKSMSRENKESMDVCIEVCANEHSIKSLTYKYKKKWTGIFELLKIGLDEWNNPRQIN